MLQDNKFESSPDDRVSSHNDCRQETSFSCLNDLSKWLDMQLESLEARHQEFATMSSLRGMLRR